VGYTYEFDPKNNQVEINTKGKFDQFTLRVPFPENAKEANASINGKETSVTVEQVNQSRYAVMKGSGSVNQLMVKFK
ncbi:MAG TPA: hypothetical protein DCL77_00660, partial [Prolixibacteraceae bacterium]|nr:hypothetical protein [Prolixibacteraceae bacterium]